MKTNGEYQPYVKAMEHHYPMLRDAAQSLGNLVRGELEVHLRDQLLELLLHPGHVDWLRMYTSQDLCCFPWSPQLDGGVRPLQFGVTALQIAARYGLSHIVRTIINDHITEEARSMVGRSALVHAIASGDDSTVDVVLKSHDSYIHGACSVPVAPLWKAVFCKSVRFTHRLLDQGVKVNELNESGTALHIACKAREPKLAGILIEAGARVNERIAEADADGAELDYALLVAPIFCAVWEQRTCKTSINPFRFLVTQTY